MLCNTKLLVRYFIDEVRSYSFLCARIWNKYEFSKFSFFSFRGRCETLKLREKNNMSQSNRRTVLFLPFECNGSKHFLDDSTHLQKPSK